MASPSAAGASGSGSTPRILDPPRPKSVLVIGGGPAGLVTLRNLLQHGPNDAPPPFERVQLIERRADVGGVWHLDNETLALEQAHRNHHADGLWPIKQDPKTKNPTERPHWPSPAYPQLRGNVLPPFTSFSDFPRFPAPAHGEPFPTLSETYDYLRNFTDNAELGANRPPGLHDYIRTETEVLGVVQLPPNQNTGQPGGWAIRIAEWSNGQNGRAHTEHWDAVALATAWYDNPVYPRTPGIEAVRSAGKLVHAKWYRSPLPHRGKRVVIVGNGNSSNDIAAHLAALKPLPGPGVTGIDAEPIYRSIKHPALPNFVSLPDERIRDVAFIEKYTLRDGDAVDVHLNDGTVLKDVDLVILGVGYGYGYQYTHLLKESALTSPNLSEVPNPASDASRFQSWDPLAYVQANSDLFERATEEESVAQLPMPTPADGTAEELAYEAAQEAALTDAERAEPVARVKSTFLHTVSTHRGGNGGTLGIVGICTVFWPFIVADFCSRVLRAVWDGSAPEQVTVSDRDECVHSNDPEGKSGRVTAPPRSLRVYGNTQLARESDERERVRELQKKRALLRQVDEQRRADVAAALAKGIPADKSLFQTAPELMSKYHCPGNDEFLFIHTLRTITLAARPDLELDRGVYEVPADPLSWGQESGNQGKDTLYAGGGRDVAGRGVGLLRADDEAMRRRNASPQIKLQTLWAARKRLEASGAYGKVSGASDVEGGGSGDGQGAISTLETIPVRAGAEGERQDAINHQQGGVEGTLPAALAGLHVSSTAAQSQRPVKAEWKLNLPEQSQTNGASANGSAVPFPPAQGSIEVAPVPTSASHKSTSGLDATLATLDKAREVLNATLTGWIGAIGKEDGGSSGTATTANGNGVPGSSKAQNRTKQAAKEELVEDDGDGDEEDDEEEDGGDDGNVHTKPPAAVGVATAAR
ncbi:unnamed protein product [Tilletia controversa]|uniref:FAD/NAD(P)-binding domain-containing protein n=1 Tax=Tilletia controversa TaxID=13291 RepID=A0A8X7SZ71_9BASI|nr:hypothetical protein CF328_g1840 [Tilletia controversa]CAD7067780.1 unnamed protein product [Tilletia caries]KAE8252227.1 hypothetical protein A4X06_0g2341 [Tilletia controversa]CAD6932544.1 unnamed protein product [Tilletia controversa]CAD6952286.1 unnamed protein product [Tilletia controversa]